MNKCRGLKEQKNEIIRVTKKTKVNIFLAAKKHSNSCADPEVLLGPILTFFPSFLLIYEGREDPSTTISGPSSPASKTTLNGVSLACP